MYIPHFIYLSLDGHLGCLYILAIVNNVVLTWVYKYFFKFLISVLLGIYPEMKFLDPMIIQCFIFWGSTILFATVAIQFYMPTGFQLLHILTNSYFLLFFPFNNSHLNRGAYLVLFETSKLFSRVTVPFYIPTSSVWLIQVLCTVFNIWYCHYFLITGIVIDA